MQSLFELARETAALAVAAIIAGWALAQQPIILPGVTTRRAAAPDATLVTIVVAVIAGGAPLFSPLVLLFRLPLGGRLGYGESMSADEQPPVTAIFSASAPRLAFARRQDDPHRSAAALFGKAFVWLSRRSSTRSGGWLVTISEHTYLRPEAMVR